MSIFDDCLDILKSLGMPPKQQSELCSLVLLALTGLKEGSSWDQAAAPWLRTHDILSCINQEFKRNYAENNRETIRKTALHCFRDAALICDNASVTNSPQYKYRLTDEALQLIRSYGSESWQKNLEGFIAAHQTLKDKYRSERSFNKIPIRVNGRPFVLSPGKHNLLQKAVLEEFATRFAPNSACLYVGDSTDRTLFVDRQQLSALGIKLSVHDKLPDLILYREEKHWLYFIEAVTTVGAMTPQRVEEIRRMSEAASEGKIYLTAFPGWPEYKRFASSLAWETEVWLASDPDHLIHLDGGTLLKPHGRN